MNGYISVKEAAARWDISERQVQTLCETGRIHGETKFVGRWAIPEDAHKTHSHKQSQAGAQTETNEG